MRSTDHRHPASARTCHALRERRTITCSEVSFTAMQPKSGDREVSPHPEPKKGRTVWPNDMTRCRRKCHPCSAAVSASATVASYTASAPPMGRCIDTSGAGGEVARVVLRKRNACHGHRKSSSGHTGATPKRLGWGPQTPVTPQLARQSEAQTWRPARFATLAAALSIQATPLVARGRGACLPNCCDFDRQAGVEHQAMDEREKTGGGSLSPSPVPDSAMSKSSRSERMTDDCPTILREGCLSNGAPP